MLKKVQVKSTGCIGKGGIYQVALKSCGGTRGTTYKTILETNIDSVFILTAKKEIYLIPKDRISNVSTLSLCDKYKKYKVSIWILIKKLYFIYKFNKNIDALSIFW